MNIRRLEEGDYEIGFLSLLSVLTKVGTVRKEKWTEQYRIITSNPLIEIWVIHDTVKNQIIGTATLLIEPKFIHECGETAGILLGRTTIESWMCGKPSWIYNVDNLGNIVDKKLYEVPNDMEKFNSKYVSEKIKEEYLKVIN